MDDLKKALKDFAEIIEKVPLKASQMIIDQGTYSEILEYSGLCYIESHPGFKKPFAQCTHPDCVIKSVLQS